MNLRKFEEQSYWINPALTPLKPKMKDKKKPSETDGYMDNRV
jgi:hypothetical protein